MGLHYELKSPVKIDSDSIELTSTICAMMKHNEKKRLTKIKKRAKWGSNQKNEDGRTDRQTAFQLYIIDYSRAKCIHTIT